MPSYPQWVYFGDGFHGANSLSNIWQNTANGNGTTTKTWSSSSVDDTAGSGSMHVVGNLGTTSPNHQPNVITYCRKLNAITAGQYSIEGRFQTDNLANLSAYELMLWFQVSGVYHQARIEVRIGQGAYVYDANNTAHQLGTNSYPSANNQWLRLYGDFDTRTLTYGNVVFVTAGGTFQWSASSISLVNTRTRTRRRN